MQDIPALPPSPPAAVAHVKEQDAQKLMIRELNVATLTAVVAADEAAYVARQAATSAARVYSSGMMGGRSKEFVALDKAVSTELERSDVAARVSNTSAIEAARAARFSMPSMPLNVAKLVNRSAIAAVIASDNATSAVRAALELDTSISEYALNIAYDAKSAADKAKSAAARIELLSTAIEESAVAADIEKMLIELREASIYRT